MAYTVVGILPKGFQPDPDADVWLPLQAEPNSTNQGHYLNVAGRLKSGVTVAAARAQMKVVGDAMDRSPSDPPRCAREMSSPSR